jgi:hypothetical protein
MAMGVCAGAAIIIGMSQVRYIVGYRVPRQDSFHEQISVLIQGRAGFKWQVRLQLAVCVKRNLVTCRLYGLVGRGSEGKWQADS